MELVETDKIDIDYIKELIYSIDMRDPQSADICIRNIKNLINKSQSDSLNMVEKKELILKFLDKVRIDARKNRGKIYKREDIEAMFRDFVEEHKIKAMMDTSDKLYAESGVDIGSDTIEKAVKKLEVTGKIDKADIRSEVNKACEKSDSKVGLKRREAYILQLVKEINSIEEAHDVI
jgi:intracellular sulfur oxidation DsrE/DsrF family protein